jgi:hypothetical protein
VLAVSQAGAADNHYARAVQRDQHVAGARSYRRRGHASLPTAVPELGGADGDSIEWLGDV